MRVLVNIDVPDLAAAVEFYEAAVGAKLLRLLDDDVAELEYGAASLYLLRKPPGSQATPAGDVRRQGRHWTPVHVDFVVADIGAAVARASPRARSARAIASSGAGRSASLSPIRSVTAFA